MRELAKFPPSLGHRLTDRVPPTFFPSNLHLSDEEEEGGAAALKFLQLALPVGRPTPMSQLNAFPLSLPLILSISPIALSLLPSPARFDFPNRNSRSPSPPSKWMPANCEPPPPPPLPPRPPLELPQAAQEVLWQWLGSICKIAPPPPPMSNIDRSIGTVERRSEERRVAKFLGR